MPRLALGLHGRFCSPKSNEVFIIFVAANTMIMKRKSHILLLFLALTLAMGCRESTKEAVNDLEQKTDTLSLLANRIQQCSRLYTTEYRVHKIVASKSNRTVEGLGFSLSLDIFGDRKVIIPMEATLKGYVDLGHLSPDNIDIDGEHITVTLPDPQVMMTATRIDQEGIKTYVTGFRHEFSDSELTALEAQGRQAIIADIPRLGIERAARASAARLLIPLISQLGFEPENIVITFRSDYKPKDLIRQIE